MKIGFSLGRCIRDIVINKIKLDDVALIISATELYSEEHLEDAIDSYLHRPSYLKGLDPTVCHDIASQIWNSKKLIQPRCQGITRFMQPSDSIWYDLFPTALSDNTTVNKAWDNYRMMLNLVENVNNETDEEI